MRSKPVISSEAIHLSAEILHHLNVYALAATTAGVAALALAEPAEARIVYTPAHVKITSPLRFQSVHISLDLNHDGVADFAFSNFFGGSAPNSYAFLNLDPRRAGNRVLGKKGEAAALPAGVTVNFDNATSTAAMAGFRTVLGDSLGFAGQWANGGKGVKDRYLGLRFMISGRVHYGWARLNVNFKNGEFQGVLTGYAYETIPNRAIVAGKTADDAMDTETTAAMRDRDSGPGTLGVLALGAASSLQHRSALDPASTRTDD